MPLESQYLESLDGEDIHAIMSGLSRERLSAYSCMSGSDVEALALYALNARFSIHLLEVIGGFEVVLRNAVSGAIINHFRPEESNNQPGELVNWYREPAFTSLLEDRHRRSLQNAGDRLRKRQWDEGSDPIVAELSFHFWVALHEKCYEHTLWTPFLRKIWPGGEDMKKVHKDLSRIREVRNRIAHHEPIFAAKWRDCVPLVWRRLDQLSPQHHAWLAHRVDPALVRLVGDLNALDQ